MIRAIFTLTILLVFMASPSYAKDLYGKVIAIADGDTFTLLDENYGKHKIRLAEIDTPEKGQPYGDKSKKALSDFIFGKNVTVKVTDTDKYGRTVGRVYLDAGKDMDVNAGMVLSGSAWVYRQYMKDESLLKKEAIAKSEKRGLWALPEAQQTPPWEWRKGSQQEIHQTIQSNNRSAASRTDTSCGSKRYCKQMSSCAEAKFYLNNCGLSRLDGDGDGVPCESICR